MRKERYNQKLNELKDRFAFIDSHLGWKEEFLQNRMLRKAVYKEFQEAIEIVADLVAMIVKDSGMAVEDDYTNIEHASNLLKLSKALTLALRKANGLRNVLVHEYNGINDSLAYDSIEELMPQLKVFASEVEKWISRQ